MRVKWYESAEGVTSAGRIMAVPAAYIALLGLIYCTVLATLGIPSATAIAGIWSGVFVVAIGAKTGAKALEK